jgi:hypothetical protein
LEIVAFGFFLNFIMGMLFFSSFNFPFLAEPINPACDTYEIRHASSQSRRRLFTNWFDER